LIEVSDVINNLLVKNWILKHFRRCHFHYIFITINWCEFCYVCLVFQKQYISI